MTTQERIEYLQEAKKNMELGIGMLNEVLNDIHAPLMWLVYIADEDLDCLNNHYMNPITRINHLIDQEVDNKKKLEQAIKEEQKVK